MKKIVRAGGVSCMREFIEEGVLSIVESLIISDIVQIIISGMREIVSDRCFVEIFIPGGEGVGILLVRYHFVSSGGRP